MKPVEIKKIWTLSLLLLVAALVKSQESGELKFSGYVQTQWTWDEAGVESGTQNDFSVRRGRLKAAYTNKYGEAVFQLDITENGIGIKDAYLKLFDPRFGWVSFRGGVFDRPFGYEISYSSSRRESPERSRIFRTLFPKERDLGAELIFTGMPDSPLENLALNIGLFSGNGGQSRETDSRKDIIGHLGYTGKYKEMNFGIGASLYSGGVRLAGDDTQRAYKLTNGLFTEDTTILPGRYAKRQYYGFDAQLSLTSAIGTTTLNGEYLWGTQPGAISGSDSPTDAVISDIYLRNFMGYYVMFVQDIGRSKHTLVAKYDAYDPNTKLSGNECRTVGDISYSTFGFGWLYRVNQNLNLTCFYEITSNEKVRNSVVTEKYTENIPDNLFTLRLQYRF